MKKSSFLLAAAVSLALGGCAAKQQIVPLRMHSRHVENANSLYVLSEDAINSGNYDLAEGYLEQILTNESRSQENGVLFNYGMARLHLKKAHDFQDRQRNREIALSYFEKVLELTDDDARFNAYRLKSESWVKYLGQK